MASKILLVFVEDDAQESFLRPLVLRLAEEAGVSLQINVRHASGGVGATLKALSQFASGYEKGTESLPDGILAAVDANCHG